MPKPMAALTATKIGALTAIAAVFLAGGTLLAQPRPMATRVFNEVGIEQRLGEQVPLDLTFTDEQGRKVPLSTYFGSKPVILSLVYYKCTMLCPQVLEGMNATFKTINNMSIGTDFDIVSVSFNHRETPADAVERKAKYIRDYARAGADENWHFLTSDSAPVAKLAEAVGFTYLYDAKTGQYAHASGIMVLTPDGKVSRYLYGIEYQADDLRFSLIDASNGKIGSPVDKLLMLCYHYDPSTGKYGLIVTNLLRGGGILAVLILGGYMLVNFLRDRRRAAAAAAHGGKA
jgi:protein SCO1/2